MPQTNRFLPASDAELGQEAAETIRAALPLITDAAINAWVADVGQRLVDQMPEPLRQPAFRYSFEILNQLTVASYPLPGGPVFLRRRRRRRLPLARPTAATSAGRSRVRTTICWQRQLDSGRPPTS